MEGNACSSPSHQIAPFPQQGVIRAGQRLLLGPDTSGGFMPVMVRECQRLHTPVALVRAGQVSGYQRSRMYQR